jgi:putative ABC transport system permease protein
MFINYLKITLRTLWKYKGYAAINLLGLSLGLTAGILILLYALDEFSYDTFHSKRDRIYKITSRFFNPKSGTAEGAMETNAWPVGKVLEKDFPEVEKVLYTRGASFLQVNYNDKRFAQKIHFAGPEFFEMFSFELVKGNPRTALQEPYSVVITKSMEEKFFPGQDALNKPLTLADSMQFIVTGVMENIPSHSHIQLDMVLSFTTFEVLSPLFGQPFSYDGEIGWGNFNMRNYVLLKEGVDVQAFTEKARTIYVDRAAGMLKDWGTEIYLNFESLNRLYLTSTSGNGMGPLGSLQRVYLVSGIAGFVILLACINFINLSTARSTHRSKEVGLRKAVGSTRPALIRQFLSESFWLTLFAWFIALALTGLLLPLFNQLLGKTYQLSSLITLPVLAGMVVLILIITLLAGYYPAIALSAMRPAEVLKGKLQSTTRGVQLRRILVVFQFTVSVCLVLGTLVVIDQLSFMQKQDLGFAKNEIIMVNAGRVPKSSITAFKNDIQTLASVQHVSLANAVPGRPGWTGQVAYPEGKAGTEAVSVEYVAVDEAYVDVLGLEVIAGRNFDPARELDLTEGLVLNEKAVAIMGWASPEEAIGKKITSPSGTPAGVVIGVVKDYHQLGLQQAIGPITLDANPQFGNLMVIRYQASETKELIAALNALWLKYVDGFEFNYSFLNEEFERQYQAEEKLAQVFFLFAVVTIVIAIIGLVGLVSFMVVSRTKEIGIRKVLGANLFTITRLLSKEFLMLVALANVVAFPVAWYLMNNWLENFAYRTTVSVSVFVITFLLAIGATVLAVGVQTIRAAMTDPVNSLRYE